MHVTKNAPWFVSTFLHHTLIPEPPASTLVVLEMCYVEGQVLEPPVNGVAITEAFDPFGWAVEKLKV